MVDFGIVALLTVQICLAGAGIVVLVALVRVKGDVYEELAVLREAKRERFETEQKILEMRGFFEATNSNTKNAREEAELAVKVCKGIEKTFDEIDARFRSLKASIASNSRRGKREPEQMDLEEEAAANNADSPGQTESPSVAGHPQFLDFGKRKVG